MHPAPYATEHLYDDPLAPAFLHPRIQLVIHRKQCRGRTPFGPKAFHHRFETETSP